MRRPRDAYRTIVADPPWPITWTGGKVAAGPSSGSKKVYDKRPLPYPTMSIDELRAIPGWTVGADDAHLFMWTLDRFVVDGSAASVCRAWGFEPLPQMIVWKKESAGLGRILRPAHELILIGRRGGARLNEISTTTIQTWRQPYENGAKKHSAKPDGSFDLIEALSPGPYLELFARRQRLGWDTWGNEARCDVALAAADQEDAT